MSSKTNATVQASAFKKPAPPRLACIDIPEFLFQWIVLQEPTWSQQPIALVAEEKPTAALLQVNQQAWQLGMRPGMRYAPALAQLPGLRGKALSSSQRQEISQQMVEILRALSPQISNCPQRNGVFYAGLAGLQPRYKTWSNWAVQVHRQLAQKGYRAYLGLGFTHLGTLAQARLRPVKRTSIAESPAQEDQIARSCRLEYLDLEVKLLASLQQLGILTLDHFLKLPAESVLDRFGPAAYQLHRSSRQELWEPIQSEPEIHIWEARLGLEYAESNTEGLLFLSKRLLDPLLVGLFRQGRAVQRLHLDMQLYGDHPPIELCIGLSDPSLESHRVLDLLRLRLEGLQLQSGVTDLHLWLEDVELPREQLELFQETSRRELRTANRALDRVRADLGVEAVVCARLQEGHLPISGFRWEPVDRLQGRPLAQSAKDDSPTPLLRRFCAEPQETAAPAQLLAGPFRISGGWWRRETVRDYYYFRGPQDEIGWGYFDQRRGHWYWQGSLE